MKNSLETLQACSNIGTYYLVAGSMSRKKDEDEDESQENLMVLRLPEKYAQIVRQAVNKGNLRERLQIDIKDDCRNALLKVCNESANQK